MTTKKSIFFLLLKMNFDKSNMSFVVVVFLFNIKIKLCYFIDRISSFSLLICLEIIRKKILTHKKKHIVHFHYRLIIIHSLSNSHFFFFFFENKIMHGFVSLSLRLCSFLLSHAIQTRLFSLNSIETID